MRLSSDRWTLSSAECGIIPYSGQRYRRNNIIRINRGRRRVHIINFYRMI